MTDDIRPTSAADGRAESMDTPLINQVSDVENSFDDTPIQSGSTAVNIPQSSAFTGKTLGKSKKPVATKESKLAVASEQLFETSQMESLGFYQSLLCEFIGTMLLTIVCTSTGLPVASKAIPDLNGALASGLIVATVIVGFGHISGAHINPAVTVTLLAAFEIDFLRALCYIGMQLLGAASASILVESITPPQAQGNLGMTMVTSGVSLTQAFVVEFIITFLLCYTVHSICDKRRDDVGGSKALAVGFSVTLGCLFGGPYTGGSMNPARSFGPAVVLGAWENHWIYWFGPLAGSITAALLYTRILRKSKPAVVRSQSHSSISQPNV